MEAWRHNTIANGGVMLRAGGLRYIRQFHWTVHVKGMGADYPTSAISFHIRTHVRI